MAELPYNTKNNITNLIHEAYKKYQNKMFSDNGGINYKTMSKPFIKTPS